MPAIQIVHSCVARVSVKANAASKKPFEARQMTPPRA